MPVPFNVAFFYKIINQNREELKIRVHFVLDTASLSLENLEIVCLVLSHTATQRCEIPFRYLFEKNLKLIFYSSLFPTKKILSTTSKLETGAFFY